MSAAAAGDLVFVGDVHLDRGDPALDPFLSFLDWLAGECGRLVLVGDLFNLWIGRPELEQPHQSAVIEKLAAMRSMGIVVRYLEGNRDYRIAPCYTGRAFHDVAAAGIVERCGGKSLFAIHGDLANRADRRYRAWRRLSRSGALWAMFRLLPRSMALRAAESLEARMRSSNLDFKREFPERTVREYASRFLRAGHDAVVLGHFHVERDLETAVDGSPRRILVLPAWKQSRRHLRVRYDGEILFEDSQR